jgi:starch synthase (maltosyl-transferring)
VQTINHSPSLSVTGDKMSWPIGGHRGVYMMNLMRSRQIPDAAFLSWIKDLGFDTLLLTLPHHFGTADIGALPPIVSAATGAGLRVQLDLILGIASGNATIVQRNPDWYRAPPRHTADPRGTPAPPGAHILNLQGPDSVGRFTEFWVSNLGRLRDAGVSGYRCKPHPAVPLAVWPALIEGFPESHFSVWTPGIAAEVARRLPVNCFATTYNSLAWWDFGADWLRTEISRLKAVAPVANTVGLPAINPKARKTAERLLSVAGSNGGGLMLPMGLEFGLPSDLDYPDYGATDWQRLRGHAEFDLSGAIRAANSQVSARAASLAVTEILSGDDAPIAVLFEPPAQLTLANRYLDRAATFDATSVLPILNGRLTGFADQGGNALDGSAIQLAPGEVRIFTGSIAEPIVVAGPRETKRKRDQRLAAATTASRVVIEAIQPTVDNGRFAVKRVVGERVTVTADIFLDGHGELSAALQYRAKDENDWRETAMGLIANDRWSGHFLLDRVGPWLFRVSAWPDRFETWRDEFAKKRAAGLDVTLELQEGTGLVATIAAEAPGKVNALLDSLKRRKADIAAILTAEATAASIARADVRPGENVSGEMAVNADRRAAEFASWYELFPRNQSGDPARHGTFRDVIGKLPSIRDMGFDVLYFPPIHPIGRTNRKGRDNTMTPAKEDPGSPYAIGATEGGHDAIHPELGTLEDFRALVDAAAAHDLELALDFAVQCSPDHPWLKQHPEWFDWRPDGGLRYAENPPKKYEDIVNVDFHLPGAIPSLWIALRDVVAFWAKEGVRIFRVDNPHTKPLAFWEWLIADIRASFPDTLFLAEAFTRPKVMYQLAKLGFSQSYTYFTWRNEKWEIESYLRELTTETPDGTDPNAVDFFRPNFFVNTPDINPIFLQHAGRAGFLIRAALATTLSGLWGMLQGFEFCEAKAVPGREEYADSDKYQIRIRPDRAPGDIVDEITRLNAIRRANPALQSHRGLAFHQAANERVLWYRKANVDRSNVIFIAVSLDPFAPQSADVEVPLWEWGLGDDASLVVDDLVHGGSDVWVGKHRTIRLDPRISPFGIWRARPTEISQ